MRTPSSKPIVLFDIDGTLFDTHAWAKPAVKATLEAMDSISSSEFEEIRQEYKSTLEKNTDYDPQDFLAFLEDKVGGDAQAMQAAYLNPAHFKAALYPEVLPVLESMRNRFSLGIFSEGVLSHQEDKIDHTGIRKFIEDEYTYILRRKTKPESLHQIPPESVIVENTPEVIAALVKDGRFRPIWINRTDLPHADAPIGVPIIKNLKELPAILATMSE